MLNDRIPKFCCVLCACIGINLDINKAGSIYMSSGYYELQIPRHLINCFKSCFFFRHWKTVCTYYSDVIMSAMASQITSPSNAKNVSIWWRHHVMFSGDALNWDADGTQAPHNGSPFSTADEDNDDWADGNCAEVSTQGLYSLRRHN